MKVIRILLSLLLVIITALTAGITVSADQTDTADTAAAKENLILGDVDGDGVVTIIDATAIQRWLAEFISLSDTAIARADADLDGDTLITDATHIQNCVARSPGTYYLGLTIENAKVKKAADEAKAASDAAKKEAQLNAVKAVALRNSIDQRIQNYKQTKGVDISEFNGDVDMKKLKKQGYSFVMIRMGFGSNKTAQDDEKFEQNVKNAEAAGLDWGAYLYSYALNVSQVKSEVNHTLRLLKGKKPTMPIAFDIENDSFKAKNGMPSDKTLHNICLTYLSSIRKAGYYPILYTGCSWLKGPLNSQQLTGTYDIWLAQWYTQMDYYTDNVGMWQYGGEINFIESPYIDGLTGMFDKDYCFKNYPLIITAYGYNNHAALLDGNIISVHSLAATSAGYEEEADDYDLPPDCNGVMGDSFREP